MPERNAGKNQAYTFCGEKKKGCKKQCMGAGDNVTFEQGLLFPDKHLYTNNNKYDAKGFAQHFI